MIKDQKGKEHLVLDSEDYNDEAMGDKPEDFEILQVLGKGSFGIVAKVRSVINNKIYAMKQTDLSKLEEEERSCCENETEILKKMNHKYVTKYYKSFEKNDKLYIITEFVNNGDLQEFIKIHKSNKMPIKEDEIWSLAMQCAECLKYLNTINIIHRDIKPANIFLTEEKTIRFGDFGVSTLIKKKNDAYISQATKIFDSARGLNQTVAGTPLYMCPEMISQQNYGPRADIYSMGCVLYELCYFCLPYAPIPQIGENGYPVMQLVKIPKSTKNKYSKELENVLSKMLEMKPENRINAEQFYELVRKEYIKKCVQNSSIEAVVRCLSAYKNLSFKYLQQLCNVIKNNKSQFFISFDFLSCLENIRDNRELNLFLHELREKCIGNRKIGNDKEIDINLVLNFILEKLHQEFSRNNGQDIIPTFGLQIEDNTDTNKNNCFQKYQNYKNEYFKSCISELFLGDLKTKRICVNKQCRLGVYSVRMFIFLQFNLNLCLNNSNKIDQWFQLQNNQCVELSANQCVYCQNCKKTQPHHEFKQFFNTPKNLIISIYRGDNCENKSPVSFGLNMSIGNFIENKNSPQNYKLVGIVKRYDGTEKENYIGLYLDSFTNCWKECNKNVVIDCPSPLNHTVGYVMMLFYTSE